MFAMAGGSPRHSLIKINIYGELRNALKGRPCTPYDSDLRIRITPSGLYTYPDASVIRGDRRDYLGGHPAPRDVALIGEVADSSLAYDRGIKKRIYARSAIPVYWIVNLEDRCIEVYTDPTGPADEPDYRQRQIYGENDWVPVLLDGKEIGKLEVKALLP